MQKKLLSRLSWCLLVISFCGQAQAQEEEEAALARLQRLDQDMSQALLQVDSEIQRDRELLRDAEHETRTSRITPAMLEDARLEQASLDSRASGLQTRLNARRRALDQLNVEISELDARILHSADDAPEQEAWRSEQVEKIEQGQVLEGLIDKLDQLHRRYVTRTALARQRLNLLQARFELPDPTLARESRSVAVRDLQSHIDSLLAEASAARRQVALTGQEQPREKAQRRLLELRAMVLEEQAELSQHSIVRLQIDRALKSLSGFGKTSSVPVRVMKTALLNIEKMQDEILLQKKLVEQKLEQFRDQRQIINQQGAIATGVDSTLQNRLQIIDAVIVMAEEHLAEISRLLEHMQKDLTTFESALASNAGAELLIKHELPTDAESWQLLAGSLATLPIRVAVALQKALATAAEVFLQSSPGTKASGVLLLLGLSMLGWQGRRLLAQQQVARKNALASGTPMIRAPLAILLRNQLSLLLPVFVLGMGLILDLRQSDLILLLAPVLIWPFVRISLDLVNDLLDEYTPELDPARTHLLVLETRWIVILAAVLAAVLVSAHTVALSPVVIDAIDRLSMLCLLLIAIPLFHLRKLLLEGVQGKLESRLLRAISMIIPSLLAICALIGIIGYGNLAWAIALRLGWLIIMVLGLHIVRSILLSLLMSTQRWFERRDAESAPYWQQYILGPSYRVTLLLVVIVAVQLLFYLYNWNDQTPLVSAIPQLLNTTLFTIGAAEIKLNTLGLALLVLFVAFWGAGWSRQVSYLWLYTGVKDQGIRTSLATFTQYLVVVLGLVVAMKVIGLDLTVLTVFAGALGVGIGFGMQTIVVNFISGILLLVERPLSTTDIVNVDAYEGEVTRIGIRSLTVKTFDNQEVIIPNSSVITKPFINWTRTDDIMRTVLMIGISYDDDPHQAVDIIKKQVTSHPAVITDPGSKVMLWDYGESALMLRAQFHTHIRGDIGRADVRSQILFAIWDAFKEAGITIPYPQRDIHMHTSD